MADGTFSESGEIRHRAAIVTDLPATATPTAAPTSPMASPTAPSWSCSARCWRSAFAATGRGPGHNADALEQKPNLMPDYWEKTPPTKEPGGLKSYLDGLARPARRRDFGLTRLPYTEPLVRHAHGAIGRPDSTMAPAWITQIRRNSRQRGCRGTESSGIRAVSRRRSTVWHADFSCILA